MERCAAQRVTAFNRDAWSRPLAAARYAGRRSLYPAEATIRERLASWLPGARMLDLGVGTGRTTEWFAPLVADYVGVDYSPALLELCRRKVANHAAGIRLALADAGDLSAFADASFDFVLFSFNGLDYAAHADRLRILAEVWRVCRRGAYFCFSSHNLQALPRVFAWRDGHYPPWTPRGLATHLLLRARNPGHRRAPERPHAIVWDGSVGLRLWSAYARMRFYYVRPSAQLAQLRAAGFGDVRLFDTPSGRELSVTHDLGEMTCDWPYYLCRSA